ncbi:ICOS ligand-like isoform X2 [Rhinatrema bivittatum]|uniref:ICOS ligand-like isoform X2 n=1 Tax=Rhinatrema bivittatum TaxID=194408 RepID=UPI00112BFB93|nr:ICOS ligand-like isoform X2 [Rhinatrema bivittatum]
MLGLILFIYTSAVQGELFCTRKRETLVGACGDSVFLPCNFSYEGFPSLTNLDLVWQLKRPGEFAVVHHEDMKGPPNLQQDSRFRNRTSVMDSWPQSRDITLTLSNISGADQGAYTCEIFTLTPYSRKICAEIQLNVHTDIRKIRYSAVQLVAFFLIPVGVALLFSAGLTLGVRRYKKRLQRKAQEERAWRDATAMPRKPLRSNENVDLTCTSISSVKPLLHSHLADPV